MSIIKHLIATDLRRHRLLLGAWLAIVIATTTLAGARPLLAVEGLRPSVGILGSLLSLTQFLLLLVLIPAVVQTHPLVGSDAFWMTRPIPPATLLVGKLVLLGVATIVLPMVAEAIPMAAYAVPPAQIAAVSAQTALYNMFWLILLATAAALTPNLTRFALLCGGALLALALFVAANLAISLTRLGDAPPMSGDTETGDPTSGLVLVVLFIVAGLALLVVQYRTRSRMRAVPVGAATMTLAFVAASVWPWPMLAPRLDVPSWTTAEAALRLSARAETVQIKEEATPFSARTPWRMARARVWLAGIEPNWTANASVVAATLRINGGTELKSVGSGYPVAAPVEGSEESPTRLVVRGLLGVDRLVDFAPPQKESPVIFVQRDAEFRRLVPAIGTYEGRFKVSLTRHDLAATLPLQRGATYQQRAYRFVVQRVEHTSTSASILARESDAASIFDRRPMPERSFYLRNTRASEAVAGSAQDPEEGFGLFMFLPFSYGHSTNGVAGFRTRNLLIRFPAWSSSNGESFSFDDAWFQGSELVLVRATREGSVERPLEVSGVPLRNF